MITHEILPPRNGVHRIRQVKRVDRYMGVHGFRIYIARTIEVSKGWVKTGAWSDYGRSAVFNDHQQAQQSS